MLTFLLRRLLTTLAIALLITYVLWLLMTYDGAQALQSLSLARLVGGPYWQWLNQVLHGDLGYSLRFHAPVIQGIQDHLLASALIIVPAFLIQEAIAVFVGITTAASHRSPYDRLTTTFFAIFASIPSFWFGLLVLILLAVNNHVFPFGDLVDLRVTGASFNTPQYWQYFHAYTWEALVSLARHLVLPVMTLVLVGVATDSQLVRSSMLEVLDQEYIRAARARGLSRRKVLWKHALRNAILPFITSVGVQLPRLVFAGAIIELVYQIPGLGRFFIAAAFTPARETASGGLQFAPRDPNLVTAYFLILGMVTLVASLLTDVAYALADPRLRAGGGSLGATPAARARAAPRTLRLAGRAIPRRNLGLAALAVLAIAAGIVVVRDVQTSAAAPPPVAGTWYRSETYSSGFFTNIRALMYLDIQINARGIITGTAIECISFGGSNPAQTTYALDGTTDNTTALQINLTAATETIQYNAAVPNAGKPLILDGTAVTNFTEAQVTAQLTRGTMAAFLTACKSAPA